MSDSPPKKASGSVGQPREVGDDLRFALLEEPVANAVPALLFACSADGCTVSVNRFWFEFTGLADARSLERAWRDVVHADDVERLASQWRGDESKAAAAQEVEFRLRDKQGDFHWHLSRMRPLAGKANAARPRAGIATPVIKPDDSLQALLASERSARAEAEALATAKDEFLAVVSHELRSPLNAIRGWAHVLRKTLNLQEGQTRPLDAIDRNVAAQARMVDDLLDTQRLLRGKVQLDIRRTELALLIEQAVDAFRPVASDKPLTLVITHASDLSSIDADPDRLRQALVNLLSNAVKFTPAGGRIEVRSERVGPDRLAISVIDSGVGLESAQVRGAYEPFRQAAGTSSTRRQGGLGLGLALARQLVGLHDGQLVAQSDGPGRGATFTIDLPAPPLELGNDRQ